MTASIIQPRRMSDTPIYVNSNAVREVTGCYGYAERDIRGHFYRVSFYVALAGGEQVRIRRDGQLIHWAACNAQVRKFAHAMAEQLKRMLALEMKG